MIPKDCTSFSGELLIPKYISQIINAKNMTYDQVIFCIKHDFFKVENQDRGISFLVPLEFCKEFYNEEE